MKHRLVLLLTLIQFSFAAAQSASQPSSSTIINGKSSVDILRNHKTPLSHVFDPASAPNSWLLPIDEAGEMPMPSGIKDELRKKIDAKRTALLQSKNIEQRGILNDKPTSASTITTDVIKGTDIPPGAGTPNDNHIAVGNDGKIVSVMNTVIRVHNDTGKVIKAFTLENFALNPNIKKRPHTHAESYV
jgi:hypothetical protein